MPAKRKRPAMQRIARRVITDTEGGSSPGTPSGVPAAEDFDFALPLESRPVTDALIAVLASNYGADDPVRRTRLKLLFEGPLAGRIERFPYSLASLSRANDATEKVYTALAYDLPCLIAPPYIMGPSWTVQGTGIFNRDQRIPFATEASSFDACACLRAWIAKHDSSLNVKEILDTAIEYHSVAVLEWILLCARPSGPPYSSGLPDHWKDELGELLGTANGRREMILLVMAGEARLIERTGGIVPKEAVARLERVFSLLKAAFLTFEPNYPTIHDQLLPATGPPLLARSKQTSYKLLRELMGHGPTLQNHNKFLAPLLAPGIVPSSYSESFLRLVCDFFPEPADRAQVIDAHLTALLERSRDTLLFRYLIRESLLPDRCESPASVFLSACFPDSGVPVPFRGYHGSGQWVNLFRSLRILLEFEARYKTFDGSSLVIKMVKAISKEQRRKRSDPRKVAAARGIMRLLLLFCPMDKGQADGVRYNGIEQDGALSCYWRRWLDRNSFGGLPSEIACEIMFSSWMFR